MAIQLQEITGFRGEKIVELCLTNYESFPKPIFKPGFLGDKWPTIDFYVELTNVRGKRPYFFGLSAIPVGASQGIVVMVSPRFERAPN